MINFQHDPLACAIALGYREGVEITSLSQPVADDDSYMVERADATVGKPTHVVTQVDGARFSQFWVDAVTRSAR